MDWDNYQRKRNAKNSLNRRERLRIAREKGTHIEIEWLEMVAFFDNRCVCCGIHKAQLAGNSLTKDHIVPICRGGSDSIRNLQPVCKNCNSSFSSDLYDYRIDYCKEAEIKLPEKWK